MKARENPFRSERVASFRYQIEPETLDRWRERLDNEERARWSIVGPEGTGKTVLLEDLARGVPDVEWLKIREDDPFAQKLQALRRLWSRRKAPLFLDGAEALPQGCLRYGFLLRPKIVATLHRPRRGLDVLFQTRFDPKAVLHLVETLTDENLSPNEADRILRIGRENDGNVRTILRELYREAGSRKDAGSP